MESENNRSMILAENFNDETAKAVIHLRNMLNTRLENIAKILDKKAE